MCHLKNKLKRGIGEQTMTDKEEVRRTERGWAGHFICADMCRFRRNTLIEYGDKKWIVSTVGKMITTNSQTKKLEYATIGISRYYETMAFVGSEIEKGYIDANVSEPIDFESDWAIGDIEDDSEQRANEMNEKVVEELMEKIQL
jgi:hypothetical protein